MSPDRYGEPQTRPCRDPRCRRGWLSAANADNPEPCPACKPHLCGPRSAVNDFAEREPSARARAAIEAERESR